MDFEKFRENLMEDLRDEIYQRTGNDCEVEATNVSKLQNAGYEGIVIRPEDSQVGINLDAQALFAAYENGKSYDDVLEGAVKRLEKMPRNKVQSTRDNTVFSGYVFTLDKEKGCWN